MSKKANAKYVFSTIETLVQPLNADLSQPDPDGQLGGVGPFDFSGEAVATAIPLNYKSGDGANASVNVDLSAASSISAVTVAELFAAINTAAPTDLTASADVTTGRIKIAHDTPSSIAYLQLWGPIATIGGFGQGIGTRVAYLDTQKSLSETPVQKDEETFTTTDSNGVDTEVISDGYRKGNSGTLTDAADDRYLKSIIDGGTYDETLDKYSVPTSLSDKRYFRITSVSARYKVGTNKEADLYDYMVTDIYSCKGSIGDRSKERGFVDTVYNWSATSPKDSSGSPTADTVDSVLTISEYEAINFVGMDSFA